MKWLWSAKPHSTAIAESGYAGSRNRLKAARTHRLLAWVVSGRAARLGAKDACQVYGVHSRIFGQVAHSDVLAEFQVHALFHAFSHLGADFSCEADTPSSAPSNSRT